jgi:hypothetical protein
VLLLVGCGSNKRRRKCFSIVWLAFIWVLWKTRNDYVFSNVAVDVLAAVDRVQRLSWLWFMNNTAKESCLLYEWVWSPTDCMMCWWSHFMLMFVVDWVPCILLVIVVPCLDYFAHLVICSLGSPDTGHDTIPISRYVKIFKILNPIMPQYVI